MKIGKNGVKDVDLGMKIYSEIFLDNFVNVAFKLGSSASLIYSITRLRILKTAQYKYRIQLQYVLKDVAKVEDLCDLLRDIEAQERLLLLGWRPTVIKNVLNVVL